MKVTKISLLFNILIVSQVQAETFQSVMEKLNQHELVASEIEMSESLKEKARKTGSWGDPKLTLSFMNYPKNSLDSQRSMMTGTQLSLTQQMSLSGRLEKLKEAGMENSRSQYAQAMQVKREIAKKIWLLAIEKERIDHIERILNENINWIDQNLKISKKLYSTGKTPQQAVLEIQMRKSELKAQISQWKVARESNRYEMSATLGLKKVVDLELDSVPWQILAEWKTHPELEDFKKNSLEHQIKANELKVSAANRNFFPDVTFGLSYTKRNHLDGVGDFVGASFSIPLPLSSERYADKSDAVKQKMASEKLYRHYITSKPSYLRMIGSEINDLNHRLGILQRETLKYAKSSRDITAKSYSRGGADYLELLRSELQYQNQLVNKVNLISSLKGKQVDYLYLQGSRLGLGDKK